MIASSPTLTEQTARAAQWRFVGAATEAVLQFALGIWLARLLSPIDFGVMALTRVVLGLAGALGGLGIGSAIVQRAVLTDRHVRAGFSFLVVFGLFGATALAIAAPYASLSLRDPRVASVLRVMAIGFALQNAASVSGALLRRHLDFRRQVLIDVASSVIGYGLVAVSLALLGFGVWSLAWGSIVQTAIGAACQFASVRHPLRPLFARRELGELLHFGIGSAGVAGVNYVALNGDNFVVGRWSGAESLGLYDRAYSLMNLPYTYASSVLSSVLFPAFARAQSDRARLRSAYLTLTQLAATVAASAMGTMAVAAPYLVRSVYGPAWDGLVLPLQILCVAGYFRALYHLGGIVAQSAGRVYGELSRQVGYALLVVAGSFIGLRYGLAGVAFGVDVAILYMFVATNHLTLNVTQTPWREYFSVQRGAIAIALVTTGLALGVRLALEDRGIPSGAMAAAILAGAAIPWSIGMLWTLGDPNLEPLRAQLPAWSHRLIDPWRRGPSA